MRRLHDLVYRRKPSAGRNRWNGVETLHPADTGAIKTAVRTSDRPVVLACPYGLRSAAVARALRVSGVRSVFALAGGLRSSCRKLGENERRRSRNHRPGDGTRSF